MMADAACYAHTMTSEFGDTGASSSTGRSVAPGTPVAQAGTRETAGQAGRYLIGAFLALALDAATVSLVMIWQPPVVLSRIAGLLVGVTTTYFFNRRFTFDAVHPASLADWGRYVLAQSLGTAINFGVSTGLLLLLERVVTKGAVSAGATATVLPIWQVWGAILVGAAAGFRVNFFTARRLLHRRAGGGGREA